MKPAFLKHLPTAVAAALLAVSAAVAPPARGDGIAIEQLRAEVQPSKAVNDPATAIWVRFVLHNPTDQPIDVPLSSATSLDGAIGLPAELLFGTAAQPAIAIGFLDEKPSPILPPGAVASSQPATEVRSLRLAPHASIAADLDLRNHFRAMRYDGNYRVEWRPLGNRMQGAVADVLVERRKDAIIVTDQGKLTFSLHYDRAPRNVDNFLSLVRGGFYDGKTFHRIVPGFLLQGGSPTGDSSGIRPDGRLIPAEFNDSPVDVGTLLMARKPADANSASCQFMIALTRLPDLDGKYTIIGQARDDESLRTLTALGLVPTNRQDRPLQSVIIRSIKLLDAQAPQPTTRSAQSP